MACKKYLDGMKLDERYIRVDLDPGFREGRKYGRGRRGGQVRDEHRDTYDPGRGGWGPAGPPRSSVGGDGEAAEGKRIRYQ